MQARTSRTLRLAGGWLVATVAFLALFAGALVGAAGGAGIADLLGTTTTTTTTSTLPTIDGVLGLVDGATGSTTTTSTSTTTTSTTTTTAPVNPSTPTTTPPANNGGGGGGGPGRGGAAAGTPVTVPQRTVPTLPPTARNATAAVETPDLDVPAVPADGAVGAAPARSMVLLDEPLWTPPLDGTRRTTLSIFDRLAGLDLQPEVIAQIMAPFPVAGPAAYSDDWGAPRVTPMLHGHEGTDIFATSGTPVIASTDGVVSRFTTDDDVSGNSLRLTATTGSYFFYGHLDRFAPGLEDGDRVARGRVLGFVGQTGNATGTDPHLHFEIHPDGGAAVNPVPYLDRWLSEAALAAEAVEAAPGDAATSLALRTRTAVRSARASAKPQAAPGDTIQLGNLQPISSTAAGPAGLLVLVAGGWFAWHRAARRRHRRMLRRAR